MTGAKTPILHGVCQGDFDFDGYRALNLDLSNLPSGAPFFDDTALVRGSVDGTKLAHFDLSLIGSAQHRVFQLPNYNARLATVAGTEDLTNKTLNGITFGGTGGFTLTDAIVSLEGTIILEGDLTIGSGHELTLTTSADVILAAPAIDGTLALTSQLPVISDVAYNATTWNGNLDGATKNAIRDKFESLAILTTPPFDDDKTLVKNVSDPTKLLKISLAGLTTGTTRTATMPDKNGTLAMLDDVPDFAGIIFGADEIDRQLYLAGDVAFFGGFTLAGGFFTILNVTGGTEITLPTEGTVATRAGEETFTNKVIDGGEATSLEKFSIRSSGAAFDLTIQTSAVLTSNRTLNLALGNADRTLTLANNFSTAGNFPITLTTVGSTSLSLPLSGQVAAWVSEPASASASGRPGQIAYKDGFFYVCIGTDEWQRCVIATW